MELSHEQIEAKRHNSFSDAIEKIKKETKKWKYIMQCETGSNEKLNYDHLIPAIERCYAFVVTNSRELYFYDYDENIYCEYDDILNQIHRKVIVKAPTRNSMLTIRDALIASKYAFKETKLSNNEIPVRNGILNRETKELDAYDITKFVRYKLNVEYKPHIDYPDGVYDIDQFLLDTANQKESRLKGLMQVINYAISGINPHHNIVMFLGEGGSGKSTFGELIESIVGKNNVSNITLEDTSDDNKLLNLMNKHVMIGDDINDEVYLDKLKHLKSLSSGKTTIINRKYKTSIAMDFNGLIIQSLPTMIKMRDRESQLKRRMLYFKFENSFINDGIDPNEITEFINQQEVKEALLYYILNEPGLAEMEEYIGHDKDLSDEMTELNDPYYELDQYVKNHTQLYQADRISISVLTALFNDLQENDVDSYNRIKSKTLSSHFRSYLEEQGYVKNKNSLMQNTDNLIYMNNNDGLIEEKNDNAIEEKHDSNDILFESSRRYLHLTPNVEDLMHKQGRSSFYERK